jgi:hypothetical protein
LSNLDVIIDEIKNIDETNTKIKWMIYPIVLVCLDFLCAMLFLNPLLYLYNLEYLILTFSFYLI